jgi:hypothetical protein
VAKMCTISQRLNHSLRLNPNHGSVGKGHSGWTWTGCGLTLASCFFSSYRA